MHEQKWPVYDPGALEVDEITIVVQINGRVRDRLQVPVGLSTKELEDLVLSQPRVKELLRDKECLKVICVPGKLINIVAKERKPENAR